MNRRRWVAILICLLLLLGGIGWWLSHTSGIRIAFHGYHEENGVRFATLSLENRSSEDIIYPGTPGVPYCHFQYDAPGGLLMGPGVFASMTPGGNRLRPGERIEFHTQLRLGSHQRDVKPPFRIGVKFISASRVARQIYLQYLHVPRNWYPPLEEIIWTDTIDK